MAGYSYYPPGVYPREEPPVVLEAARPRYRRRLVSENYMGGPPYYQPGPGLYYPDDDLALHRSRSSGGRMPATLGTPPVVINNVNQEELLARGRPVSVAGNHYYEREGSRYRDDARHATAADLTPYTSWEREKEKEQMQRELEAFKREKERQADEDRVKTEMLMKVARDAQKKREEEERRKDIEKKAIADWEQKERARIDKEKRDKEEEETRRKAIEAQAVLDWQRKEREKADKEKEEKAKREEEYKDRLKKDFGLTDAQVKKVLSREKENASGSSTALDTKRKTYTKIARKHISLETLRAFDLPYKLDDVGYSSPIRSILEFPSSLVVFISSQCLLLPSTAVPPSFTLSYPLNIFRISRPLRCHNCDRT